jgi:hypothetical protein
LEECGEKTVNKESASNTSDNFKFFFLDHTLLERTKQDALEGEKHIMTALEVLKSEADAALEKGPFLVMDKTSLPPDGDKHN